MAQENHNKIKLLKLLEILRQETDEEHPISRRDLYARLNGAGFPCDIRTLSKDIAVLNDFGYEVMSERVDGEKLYYVADRSFDVPEIKILIDAVQAATFITEKKSNELITKLAALGGSYQADIIESNLVYFNTRKHSNEQIYYSVDTLEKAIQQGRKVIFKYFDIDENGEHKYRRDGHHYVVEPVALVFNEDNYYMVCYSSRHDGTSNYRIDRMESVEMIEESVTEKAIELRNSVAGITESAFKMYNGAQEDITLEFDDKLAGAVYDKFGENTKMLRANEHTLIAAVKVQISPTFWGWVFQFGGKLKINSPERIKEEYKQQMQKLILE